MAPSPDSSPQEAKRFGHYERLGELPLAQVLPLIRGPGQEAMLLGRVIRVAGLRLATFARDDQPCCSDPNCGMKATHFAIERTWHEDPAQRNERGWHLNLYGRNANGHEVLFTHDHTLARALGGKDAPDNTTAMCVRCNQRKSVLEHQKVKALRLAKGLPANHSVRGRQVYQQPSEQSMAKDLARARQHLSELAQARGLDEDTYRALCEREGLAHVNGRDTQKYIKRRAWIAAGLGLSRTGYRFLRHDHNEHQKALRQVPVKKRPGPV